MKRQAILREWLVKDCQDTLRILRDEDRLVSRPRQSAPPFVAPRIGSTRALNPAGGAVRVPKGPARLPSDGHPTLPSKRGMELTVGYTRTALTSVKTQQQDVSSEHAGHGWQ